MKLKDVTLQEIKGIWGDELQDGERGTPVIKTNNMTYEGHLDLSDITFRIIPASKVTNCLLRYGDLLIEKSGGTKTHSVGYINIFEDKNDKYVANNFILVLRPNNKLIDSRYLFYQLKYRYESGQIEHLHNQTTGIQNLKVQSYLDQEIKYVPLETQQEISTKLDQIEKIIKLEKSALNSLDALIKSRFNEIFGDPILNELDFDTKELSKLAPFNAIKNRVTITERTWLLNLDMIESETGRIIEKIRTNEIGNSTIEFDTTCVLYSKLRPYLNKVAIPNEDGIATSELISMKCNPQIIKREYLATALRHHSFVDYINSKTGGAKMPRANMDELRTFKMPVPPIELQNEFSSFVEQIDKLKFNVQKRIEKYRELLNKKMDEYFN